MVVSSSGDQKTLDQVEIPVISRRTDPRLKLYCEEQSLLHLGFYGLVSGLACYDIGRNVAENRTKQTEEGKCVG